RAKVTQGHDLAPRDVAELRAILEEDGRRELRQELVGQIEFDVETFQPGEHRRLYLGEDLTAVRLEGMWQRGIGEQPSCLDVFWGGSCELLERHEVRQPGRRADA